MTAKLLLIKNYSTLKKKNILSHRDNILVLAIATCVMITLQMLTIAGIS